MYSMWRLFRNLSKSSYSKCRRTCPLINPNLKACLLCEDYPCINSCKTGALIKLNKKEIPSFGKARLFEEFCLNTKINVLKNNNTSNKSDISILNKSSDKSNISNLNNNSDKNKTSKIVNTSNKKSYLNKTSEKSKTPIIENTSNKLNKNIVQNFCNICEKTCPIKNAVYLDEKNYKPIFTDYCSGCGICKEYCPSDGGGAIMIMSD